MKEMQGKCEADINLLAIYHEFVKSYSIDLFTKIYTIMHEILSTFL